jgi:hypothetical protein
MTLFLRYDAGLTACVFAALMVAGWRLGAYLARRAAAPLSLSRFDDGALALFGLLLAFCFSGSAARYDARKKLVLDEATAIGDFAGTAAVLAEPERGQLLREVHGYIAQRLVFGDMRYDDPNLLSLMARTRASQGRIAALVARAVRTLNTTTVHVALVNNLNAMTTAHDNQLQGLREHIPESIVGMLLAFGVFSTFTMGRLPDNKRPEPAIAYIALVALVFWVTLDLEMPRRGLLRVSQQPMQEVLENLPAP